MKLLSVNDRTANNAADNMKGRKNLLKLIPLPKMEITCIISHFRSEKDNGNKSK